MTAETGYPTQNSSGRGGSLMNGTSTRYEASLAKHHEDSPPPLLKRAANDDIHDFICIGFGPAALAIAVALHDVLESQHSIPGALVPHQRIPKVAFVERQSQFSWHSGMQLHGARMQITFMKDMATLRDPRSQFTFVNYLHRKGRLVSFMNLGTFLPLREEYEDYFRWCAETFHDVVHYNTEAVDVLPNKSKNDKVDSFTVATRNMHTGHVEERRARHVIIAVGGRPHIPRPFPQHHPRIIPSAQYVPWISSRFPSRNTHCRVAVVGAGQSAAEIFNDLQSRYPNCESRLIIRGGALRPSDDSPFVNEIFDPSRVDNFYSSPAAARVSSLALDRDTNYGVVRLELLESIYHKLYHQRIEYPHEEQWSHRILNFRSVKSVETREPSSSHISDNDIIRLHLHNHGPLQRSEGQAAKEFLDVDAVILAAGYERNTHEELLEKCRELIPGGDVPDARLPVARDYRIPCHPDKVADDAVLWTQGCNEETHGLSDTLLSILATRGGEMVRNIFGESVSMNGVLNRTGALE